MKESRSTGEPPRYWFPAKTFGWGWGLPSTWEGWLILTLALLLYALVAILFLPSAQPVAFVASVLAISTALLLICWIKGEPLKWRWGK